MSISGITSNLYFLKQSTYSHYFVNGKGEYNCDEPFDNLSGNVLTFIIYTSTYSHHSVNGKGEYKCNEQFEQLSGNVLT